MITIWYSKNGLKRQVVCETRVAKTCPCKVNTFLLLEFEAEGIFQTVATHLQLYTLKSYIFAVVSLHKRCMVPSLHKAPVYAKSGVTGHIRQVVPHHRDFFVQSDPCMEFRS